LHDPQAQPLRQLVPGRTVRVLTDLRGRLVSLRYVNGDKLLAVDRKGDDYTVSQEVVQLERREVMASADITSSLYGATDAAGLSDTVATQLADIFSSDVDFHSDLRKGDHFSVVYEAFYNRGEFVKTGRVLAAEFTNDGKTYRAVYFKDSDTSGGYYTMDGKSLRKQFLRSPLEFSRITSGFSGARFHPLLHLLRAHTGVDYGAPIGTRVRATADGVVDFMGWSGGYGNLVILRHQSSYSTYYGHLSAFARDLKRGQHVSQGEVIAYVGATGLATGPHLHYEFRIANQPQNPLHIAIPGAVPLGPAELLKFQAVAKQYAQPLTLLHGISLARLD
jgi:murein DD-endopeptidase MepM/ murein hydrolase activator NlpD